MGRALAGLGGPTSKGMEGDGNGEETGGEICLLVNLPLASHCVDAVLLRRDTLERVDATHVWTDLIPRTWIGIYVNA